MVRKRLMKQAKDIVPTAKKELQNQNARPRVFFLSLELEQ